MTPQEQRLGNFAWSSCPVTYATGCMPCATLTRPAGRGAVTSAAREAGDSPRSSFGVSSRHHGLPHCDHGEDHLDPRCHLARQTTNRAPGRSGVAAALTAVRTADHEATRPRLNQVIEGMAALCAIAKPRSMTSSSASSRANSRTRQSRWIRKRRGPMIWPSMMRHSIGGIGSAPGRKDATAVDGGRAPDAGGTGLSR